MRRVSIKLFPSSSRFKINIFSNKADKIEIRNRLTARIFVTGGYLKAKIKTTNESFGRASRPFYMWNVAELYWDLIRELNKIIS